MVLLKRISVWWGCYSNNFICISPFLSVVKYMHWRRVKTGMSTSGTSGKLITGLFFMILEKQLVCYNLKKKKENLKRLDDYYDPSSIFQPMTLRLAGFWQYSLNETEEIKSWAAKWIRACLMSLNVLFQNHFIEWRYKVTYLNTFSTNLWNLSLMMSNTIKLFHNWLGAVCADDYTHDDVIKWKHSPPSWPFVRGIHRSPVNSPHKGQWRGALMFPLNCAWINSWVNNREAGDLRRHHAHDDVSVM